MKNFKSRFVCLVALFAISFTSSANLISNGSFENEDVADGSWEYFYSSDVEGWEGSNIEIWDSLTSFESYEGEQFAELNAHSNTGVEVFSIVQIFETVIGVTYSIDFAYAARVNNNESFLFEILSSTSEVLSSVEINDHIVNTWSTYSGLFTATSTTSAIQFTSVLSATATMGNFIDDISVYEVSSANEVPEPSSILLMSLGLLVLARFKKTKL